MPINLNAGTHMTGPDMTAQMYTQLHSQQVNVSLSEYLQLALQN